MNTGQTGLSGKTDVNQELPFDLEELGGDSHDEDEEEEDALRSESLIILEESPSAPPSEDPSSASVTLSDNQLCALGAKELVERYSLQAIGEDQGLSKELIAYVASFSKWASQKRLPHETSIDFLGGMIRYQSTDVRECAWVNSPFLDSWG